MRESRSKMMSKLPYPTLGVRRVEGPVLFALRRRRERHRRQTAAHGLVQRGLDGGLPLPPRRCRGVRPQPTCIGRSQVAAQQFVETKLVVVFVESGVREVVGG